jgi:tRNA modification GTPase
MNETIFALATAKGRAGIAVIRLSGPLAFEISEKITGRPVIPRRPMLRRLTSGGGIILDEALVLAFQKGASFTGEDVVEFQCHGSPAVVDAVIKELSSHPARLAEPGEFTRRALENGCLDLSQVEGLSDLLEAETEAQRVQAFRVMRGALSDKVEIWRSDLIRAAALIEATIDFADEEVPVDVSPEVGELIAKIKTDLKSEIDGSYVAERIRDGFEVAIVGPPNVGKSTLLNTLAGREAAITSEIAGTTRDVIEVRMDIKGLPVTLLDTAGLRNTEDHVESLGIALAKKRAQQADLRVFLLDGDMTGDLDLRPVAQDIVVTGKADLLKNAGKDTISSVTGQGVDYLIDRIAAVLGERSSMAQNAVRQRHRIAMMQSLNYLNSAEELLPDYLDISEVIALELNRAVFALNSLIGRVGVEDLLDEIFSSFCLGK